MNKKDKELLGLIDEVLVMAQKDLMRRGAKRHEAKLLFYLRLLQPDIRECSIDFEEPNRIFKLLRRCSFKKRLEFFLVYLKALNGEDGYVLLRQKKKGRKIGVVVAMTSPTGKEWMCIKANNGGENG